MIVSQLERVSRHYGPDTVFADISGKIEFGDRVGLVGPNGAGKTTLLRLIAGEDPPDTGKVHRHPTVTVADLRQYRDLVPSQTLMAAAREPMQHLEDWYREMIEAGQQMAASADPEARQRASEIYDQRQEQLRHHGGYDFEHRIEEVLFGLGFTSEQFDRPIGTFSGGQQSRVLLARLLLESPDLMLLDEPTNHLDIATTAWLEEYLARQEVAMVVVSHDRMFLDKTVTQIFELNNGALAIYPGNYSRYRSLRAERQKVAERVAGRQEEEIARLEAFVRKNKAGQLSKQAKSREKMIARIENQSVERIRDVGTPPMGFGEASRTGDVVLSCRDVSKAYRHTLFENVTLEIERGWRVGIIGPNGAGKTTLLRILLGEELPTKGKARVGHNVRVGYLRQEVDDLDPDETCLEAVRPPWRASEKEESFRGLLARFGIGADLAEHRVRTLSGGQRTRLALARIAADAVNVLVLDEPTNHLDLWAVDALEDALGDYEGTVVVVSHDRTFLNAVCDRILVVENESVRLFRGNYDDYAAARAVAERPAVKSPSSTPAVSTPSQKKKRKYPYRKAKEIEADIAARESEIAELEKSLLTPEVYTDGRAAHAINKEIDIRKAELEQLLAHWEEAMELNG